MVEDENLRFTSDALDFETEVMSYPDQVKTGYELYKAETSAGMNILDFLMN